MPLDETSLIAKIIAEYISEEILEDDITLDFDDNLLSDVGVDSLGMLRLVGFIESHYSLKISPTYFTIDNFRSINAISRFTQSLLCEKEDHGLTQ